MILKINLSDENKMKEIFFQLNNLPHTLRYLNLMNKSFGSGWNSPLYTSYQIKKIDRDQSELNAQIESLNSSIDFFNKNQDFFQIKERFEMIDGVSDYHEILNVIHSKFEEYWNIFNVDSNYNLQNIVDINSHLGNINQMVHLIDTEVHYCGNKDSYEFYFSTHMGSESGNILYEDLADIDYDSFTLSVKFGDIFLGYSTVGKSIIHCWSDNDIEIVKSGKVSPQRVMSTNIIAYFNKPERNHLDILSRFYDWFDYNGLSDYCDKFDKKNSLGYLKIGELINHMSLSDSSILDNERAM